MAITGRDFKSVPDHRLTEPFDFIEIHVGPVSIASGKVVGHRISIMDTRRREGSSSGLDYAEAEATAVLKAIRKYRRQNKALFEQLAEETKQ